MEMNKAIIPFLKLNSRRNKGLSKILIYVILIILALLYFFPFIWMISTSLKITEEIYQYPPTVIPKKITFENYRVAVTRMPFLRYFTNTVVISVLCAIGNFISGSMVAFSMSKIGWKGSRYLFPIIVGTMMIPHQVTMIPLYIVFSKLKMVGSIVPLVLPAFLGTAYYIFLLRQFFKTLPDSLVESATIDGASYAMIFTKIVLPLCKPALTSVVILSFLASWSDFLRPMLYLTNQNQYTLSLGLQAFMLEHFVEWGPMMAAALIFTLPIIIIFFFAQSYFIEGITVTGIKG
jgi:multiple sugar transport system permease protein